MSKIRDEIKYDLEFVKSHRLQPKWFKAVKIFILLGFLAGYWLLFGLAKTATFLGIFLFLMLIVHFTYRVKTEKYTRSWLDFTAASEMDPASPKRIGKFYYPAILVNAALAVAISQIVG